VQYHPPTNARLSTHHRRSIWLLPRSSIDCSWRLAPHPPNPRRQSRRLAHHPRRLPRCPLTLFRSPHPFPPSRTRRHDLVRWMGLRAAMSHWYVIARRFPECRHQQRRRQRRPAELPQRNCRMLILRGASASRSPPYRSSSFGSRSNCATTRYHRRVVQTGAHLIISTSTHPDLFLSPGRSPVEGSLFFHDCSVWGLACLQ
jgi:hypothetical protein